ncbi:reverse transcriptase family protein [Hugenholtzia roseola]|uniref:reverse transcriptase family protein n=1 Tax=Hugenholtzia roseola TaxID=1002 RepID=UPI001378B279|nr:reverse transcriptase family protein [Hugenholtzia roseola]
MWGKKTFFEPNPFFKRRLQWLYRQLLPLYEPPACAFAYIKGRNYAQYRAVHQKNHYIYAIDLKSFFNSITTPQVNNALQSFCSPAVAGYLADALTAEGVLPIGFPTSPLISNIVFKNLDEKIVEFANKEGLSYSRYADDILISSNKKITTQNLNAFVYLIEKNGFKINFKKFKKVDKNTNLSTLSLKERRFLNLLLHQWQKKGYMDTNLWFLAAHRKSYAKPQDALSNFLRAKIFPFKDDFPKLWAQFERISKQYPYQTQNQMEENSIPATEKTQIMKEQPKSPTQYAQAPEPVVVSATTNATKLTFSASRQELEQYRRTPVSGSIDNFFKNHCQ